MYTEANTLILIFVGLTLAIGAIIGYFVYSMIRMHRSFVLQTDLQNQAKIIALENERKLLAADLHDDITPILSAINMKLQTVNVTEPAEYKLLKEAIGHVDSLYTRIKELSQKLFPQALGRSGPLYAMEAFVARYHNKPELNVKVKAIATPGLSGENSLHVFRMLQEIFHNCTKHSNAQKLRISGEIIDKKLIIRTSEDGIGFNLDPIAKSKGLGLQNLELRARILGANLVTDSGMGRGTRYIIEVPLDK